MSRMSLTRVGKTIFCVSLVSSACGGQATDRAGLGATLAEGTGGTASTEDPSTAVPDPTGSAGLGTAGTTTTPHVNIVSTGGQPIKVDPPSIQTQPSTGGAPSIVAETGGAPNGGAPVVADAGTSAGGSTEADAGGGTESGGTTSTGGAHHGGSGGAGNANTGGVAGYPGGIIPSNDLRFFTIASSTSDGRLVGARNDGTQELVELIDPVTEHTEQVGTLGDLQSLSSGVVYDPSTRTAYAIGFSFVGGPNLYSLSIDTQVSTSVPVPQSYTLGGVNGSLIGTFWSGANQAVAQIDTATGQETRVGALGDLQWLNEFVYDGGANVAYAIGGNSFVSSNTSLYALSLSTGVSTKTSIDRLYDLGSVTSDGRIIAAYWSETFEQVVLLDPTTGGATNIGVFGALSSWSGQMAYDASKRVVFAIGMDRNDVSHVFHVYVGG